MSKFWRECALDRGGAGCFGSHLIGCLFERGQEVFCVDNLFTGDKCNIDHLTGHPRFKFIGDPFTLPEVRLRTKGASS